MKRNKMLATFFAMVMAFIMLAPGTAKAQTVTSEGIEINLGDFGMHLPDYDLALVNVETVDLSPTKRKVTIIDKATGDVLDSVICEEINESNANLLNSIDNSKSVAASGTSFYYTIQREKTDQLSTVRLDILVVMQRDGGYSSISEVVNSSMYVISSSSSTLENQYAYARSVSGTFPSSNIEYIGTGVITLKTTKTFGRELAIGFTLEQVVNFGYTYQNSDLWDVYLRKPVTIQGNFYTY